MLAVLIRCPSTGRHISTGIETSSECVALLTGIQQPMQCPFCRKEHRWTMRDAILVPPDRWSDVPEIEDCFLKAVENAEHAAAAKKDEQRQFYLRMERKWLGLADGYRFISEVERLHGDVDRPGRALLRDVGHPRSPSTS